MVGPKPVRTKAVKPKSQEKPSSVKKTKKSSASEEASVKKEPVVEEINKPLEESSVKKVKESSASEEASVKKKSVEEKKDDGNNNENDEIISECAGASVEEDQVCHQRMFHVLLDHF